MSRAAEKLSHLRITVLCKPGSETSLMVRHLQRCRSAVRQVWPIPDRVGSDCDLVICDFVEDLAMRLPWSPGEAGAALLIVLPENGQYSLARLQGACPDAVIHRPAPLHAIETSVLLAVENFAYLRRLRTRIDRLEENIRAARTIEKAKQMLMSLHDIGEDKAFHLLRDMAMQKRVTIASLAGGLVDSASLLTYKN